MKKYKYVNKFTGKEEKDIVRIADNPFLFSLKLDKEELIKMSKYYDSIGDPIEAIICRCEISEIKKIEEEDKNE